MQSRLRILLLTGFVLILSGNFISAFSKTTNTSIQSGNWNLETTRDLDLAPGSTDHAIIINGAGGTLTKNLTFDAVGILIPDNQIMNITEPLALTGSIISQTNIACFGDASGSVTVAGTDGAAPYDYSIDGGVTYQGSGTFAGLSANNYTIRVRDAMLFTFDMGVTITQPATSLSGGIVTKTNVVCFGGSTGSVTVMGTNGTSPYNYSIDGGSTYQAIGTFGSLFANNYTVTIRDANLCTYNIGVNISQPGSPLSGSIGSQANVSCFGDASGSLTIAGSGGTPGYLYSINGGTTYQASGTFSSLSANNYTVTVQDANLCTFNVAVTITQPAIALSGSISDQTNVACLGGANGSVTIAGSGGTSPYQYSINGGATYQISGTFSGLAANNYIVRIRDNNACTYDVAVTIIQPSTMLTGNIDAQTDVACFGDASGSVIVSGSGGTSPYTYSLNGAPYQASGNYSDLSAQAYLVIVQDINGCIDNVNVTITQPAAPLIGSISSQTNVACFGDASGSVTVEGVDGTGPYEYSIDGGTTYQVSGTFAGLDANSYTITIRDASLCTFDVAVTITQPAEALSGSIASQTDVGCFGDASGSVTVARTGGTAPYQYSIDGGTTYQGSGSFASLAANNYTVRIRDANTCIFDVPVSITQAAGALSGSIASQTDVGCFGNSIGSVTVAGVDGTAPYQYSIDGGSYQLSGIFSDLSANNYTVTIRDANSCTYDVNVTISQPASAVSGLITSQTNVACFGDASGSVSISGAGGVPGYQYSLNGGSYQASETFSGLTANNYIVTIQDNNSCTFDAAVMITQPAAALSGSITAKTDVACFGDASGSVAVSGADGTAPYQYSIDGGTTYQGSGTFAGLAATNYTVRVSDANSCIYDVAVSITQPAAALSGSITAQTDIACFGDASGSVTVTGVDGTAPYQYSIDGGTTYQGSGSFIGLAATNYTVSVRDANSCIYDVAVSITQPAAALSGSITAQTNVACFGDASGSVTVTGADGTVPYQYSIDGGMTYQVSGTFAGLAPNNYTVRVSDANSCIYDVAVSITQPAAALSGSITAQTDVACFGDVSGSVTVTGADGTEPYEYSIDGGTTYQVSGSFAGLEANNYTITVRDASLCAFDIAISIIQPSAAIFISGSITDISCNGLNDGTLTIVASGGTIPYEYSIDGGVNYLNNGGSFTGLSAGEYDVMVRDVNGCTALGSTVSIIDPVAISIDSEIPTDITCNGTNDGTITIVALGGTTPYEYSIDGGVNYLNNEGNFTGLSAGDYDVMVRDVNGCTAIGSTVSILDPVAISIDSETPTDISCNGANDGTIAIVASGGVLPYEYSIDGGTNYLSNGGTFSGLSAGDFEVIVRDARGCTFFGSTLTITEPTLITLSASITNVSFNVGNDGAIDLTVSGGVGPYTYVWSSLDGSGLVPGDEDQSGLTAGTYDVIVTDAIGCDANGSYLITELLDVTVTGVTTDLTCNASGDGTIVLTVEGGTSPYTYNWSTSNGNGIVQGQKDQSTLSAGDYNVIVTDVNMVTGTVGFTLNEPAAIVINVTVSDVSCYGDNDGEANVSASGGAGTFTYEWSNGQNGSNVSNLPVGNYTVTATDSDGCSNVEPFEVRQPEELRLSPVVTPASCPGDADGTISLNISGGTEPFSITWNDLSSSEDRTGLEGGTYHVEVVDNNMCIVEDDIDIPYDGGCLEIPKVFTPNGDGANDTWRIRGIELYPNARMQIFTRWGKLVYSSSDGYNSPWDGTDGGKALPMDSYQFILNLGDGSDPITGNVTIVL